MKALKRQAVLFDLDGTFADSAADLTRALNCLLANLNCAPISVENAAPYASHGARGMLKVGLGITPEHPEFSAFSASLLNYYAANICVDSKPYPGISTCVEGLKYNGILWGIVTNKAAQYTHPMWQLMQREHQFLADVACVVCGDTTPHRKPHPASLLHAAEILQVPPQNIIYVGDDIRDIQAAKAAGMASVAAVYGYVANGSDVNAWGADAMAYAPDALLEILLPMLEKMPLAQPK